jgi:uncharacterized 2Fe-2S/4Fe-4S cluster protein (DUF4445 family)
MSESENQKHLVIFQPSGRRGYVAEGESLRQASQELGVDIEGVCSGTGTCGTCKVRIEDGFFEKYGVESKRSNLSPLTEAERKFIDAHMESKGYRLACQAQFHGDVVVFVPEESRTGKQVVGKAAKEIAIKVKPAVRKFYVDLVKATLGDTLGDWERLQAELSKKFNLANLSIDYQVLLSLQGIIRQDNWKVTVSVWMDREVIRVEPGLVEKGYGLAIDVGTTTVAGYLCDLDSGTVVATESIMNPQVIYGEDVMSRITYCMVNKDGLELMNQAIIKGINELAGRAAAQAHIKRRDIIDMTIVGNTCMHHLFLNIDPRYIGRSPFPSAVHHSLDIKARDLRLKISPGAYVHVLPIEAGFVGADNVGVLITEMPYQQDNIELVIDIGTNGELILGNRDKLISCSCATGPAFEGAEIRYGMRAAPGAIEKIEIDKGTKEVRFKVIGKDDWNTDLDDIGAKGICGSGIIDIVPQLFMAGIIDHTGRFNKDLKTPRLRVTEDGPEFVIAWANETSISQDIVVCQGDVRNIQLAKAAMYAGAKVMMHHLGVDKLDKVILAGAFGSCIDKESAACLGLFPNCALENIHAVGNAAGDGARIALLNVDKRTEANEMARQVEYIELTVEPDFGKVFSQAMWLPHMKDAFPDFHHLLREKVVKVA